MSIEYTVRITDASAHLIDVQLRVSSPDKQGQELRLPNWIPGSYMIRDFSRNLISLQAWEGEKPVQLEKLDKSGWRAPAGLSQLTVCYRVYAWDLSVRAAHVDRTHAFFNGTSVFLSVCGQENQPQKVEFERPTHDVDALFKLATTLDPADVDDAGFGHYKATDYDELIDHPVEQGNFKKITFSACGVQHAAVFTGACFFDESRVRDDLQRICEHQIRFFGEPAPFNSYLFMTMVVDNGYGGLEHRSSTALMATRESLPVPGQTRISDKYLEFLGLCSHEYFHNWNVKRMKPARFIPYELTAESYTRLLWFFEGMTSYYDDLFLVRCGLIDEKRYLKLLATTLTRVQRGGGRLVQSVTDSSFDAWHKFYKQDENAPNAIVSYYAKGALIALCLDSLIRKHSGGGASLDTLMKTLWSRWLESGAGLEEDEPQRVVDELVPDCAALQSFLQSALYSAEELPTQDVLLNLGVSLQWQQRRSGTDTGGVRKATDDVTDEMVWTGALLADAPGGVRITHVLNDSPAEIAGLAAGDILIAIEGLSVDKASYELHMQRFASLDSVGVHYFRLGQLHQSDMPVRTAPFDTAGLEIVDDDRVKHWLFNDSTLYEPV
ncbi:MAG: M61 family metallopeptidase [Granulosicoccus sp.]